jgi:hypothetical protein
MSIEPLVELVAARVAECRWERGLLPELHTFFGRGRDPSHDRAHRRHRQYSAGRRDHEGYLLGRGLVSLKAHQSLDWLREVPHQRLVHRGVRASPGAAG